MILQKLGMAVVLFLPALSANGAPPLFKKLPYLKKLYVPINVRLFGKNKTWGGVLAALIMGALTGTCLIPLSLYSVAAPIAGLLLGLGSSLGDLLGSFAKRRIDYSEGEYIWLDSADWLVGAWIVLSFLEGIGLFLIGVSLILPLIVFIVDYISWKCTPFKESL